MTEKRALIHAIFLALLPFLVAWYGLSVATTLALVILLLLWQWLIALSGLVAPEKTPDLVLETISISHFVEKVRWCMDRLGLDYTEVPSGGTLGIFYRGRTVPQLKIRTGAVRSVIGNSSEILRYLWGRYGHIDPALAAFLQPNKERAELEQRLDRHGVNLQVWVYYRMLGDRDLTLHAWGRDNPAVPLWQRYMLRLVFPLQVKLIRRAFRITDESFARAVAHIEDLLADMNSALADGRRSILGDHELNYTDLSFAALTSIWMMPAGYGGGQAETVRIDTERMPEPMRMDVSTWRAAYPHAVEFVERLYRDERLK